MIKIMSLMTTFRSFMIHPIGRKKFIFSIKNFFVFQLYSVFKNKPFVFYWHKKTKLIVNKGDSGLTGNVYLGLHEFSEMGFLLHYLNKDDVFIDVGANMGSYSVLAGSIKKCSVHSFEPAPQTFYRLKENVMVNSLKNVKLYNIGLGNSHGTVFFTNYKGAENHVLLNPKQDDKSIKVPVKTLDSFGIKGSVLKIDTEGYEWFVLSGSKQLLNSSFLKCVIVELNEVNNRYSLKEKSVKNILFSNGFIAGSYDPFTRCFKKVSLADKTTGNVIFIKDGCLNEVVKRTKNSAPYSFNGVSF